MKNNSEGKNGSFFIEHNNRSSLLGTTNIARCVSPSEVSLERFYFEFWKDISGYEGLYKISTYGRILSLKKYTGNGYLRKSIILKYCLDGKGYHKCNLYKEKMMKTFKIHKLVAEHFLIKDFFRNQINHKDGIKTNNMLNNLEYVTTKENVEHAIKKGLINRNKITGKFEKGGEYYEELDA
jgi:hypothetical protein